MMAVNDYFRLRIYGTNDDNSGNGNLEIAIGDDGCEQIYVRQYIGDGAGNRFKTISHEACLLDSRGNTSFPGIVTATNFNGLATNAAKDINGNVLQGIYDNAGAHNSVYRGKDLTSYFDSGEMSTTIANGTFTDIFPGDYIIKSVTVNGTTYSNVKWVVCDLDYFLYRGNGGVIKHHVVMTPIIALGIAQMNSTDTTVGGYIGSDMWKTTMPLYATGIQNAFGSGHVLSHKELLTNVMTSTVTSMASPELMGASTGSVWTDVICNIFNENMLLGSSIRSSSSTDVVDRNSQLAVMQHNKTMSITPSMWYWLSSVTSKTQFCHFTADGFVSIDVASSLRNIRPYFLLY